MVLRLNQLVILLMFENQNNNENAHFRAEKDPLHFLKMQGEASIFLNLMTLTHCGSFVLLIFEQ